MSQDYSRAVAWRYELGDGWAVSEGSFDPRRAHDSGKIYEPLVPLTLLAEAESRERKAAQQLKETNRQLSCGVSIGGRQFYGTPDDVTWLTDAMKARDALQSRLDAVGGSDMKAAYELLWSHTSVGSYGRQCIEVLRDTAYPEEKAARDAARKDYCPYCFSWVGGPLICCENGYTNPQDLDHITKAEAQQLRSAALGGE